MCDCNSCKKESDYLAYDMVAYEDLYVHDLKASKKERANSTNIEKFLDITSSLAELYEKKNKDYGNAFGDTFKEFGLVSAVIRLNDKMNRLKKLISTGEQEVKDESIRDTLVDLANYSIMTIMELDKNEGKSN